MIIFFSFRMGRIKNEQEASFIPISFRGPS